MKAWTIHLEGKEIDTVFTNGKADGGAATTAEDVRRSLIEHDGYDPRIVVRQDRRLQDAP